MLSLVIPIYNEIDGIIDTIKEIKELGEKDKRISEIILVDDGSSDGTYDLMIDNVEKGSGITILRHKTNKGYGAALKSGINYAKTEFIGITDADRTYPNMEIPSFLDEMLSKDLDMLVGARTSKSAKIPLIRRPAKWVLNQLANYLTGVTIPDLNSGLRLFKTESLKKYLYILPDGFSFTTTITLAMLTNNFEVQYRQIDYFHRAGSSKIRPIYDTLNFTQLIIRTILLFNPLKIFIPMFFIFSGLGLFLLAARAFLGVGLGVVTAVVLMGAIQLLAIGMLADLIDRRDRK